MSAALELPNRLRHATDIPVRLYLDSRCNPRELDGKIVHVNTTATLVRVKPERGNAVDVPIDAIEKVRWP